LRRLTRACETIDYAGRVIAEPQRFGTQYMVAPGSRRQRLALAIVRHAYWLVPGYIWLLRKPV